MTSVLSRIKALLAQRAGYANFDSDSLENHIPVFGPGGIITNSLDVLDALTDIEECFGISIPDEDLTEELFASIANLADYIQRHRDEA